MYDKITACVTRTHCVRILSALFSWISGIRGRKFTAADHRDHRTNFRSNFIFIKHPHYVTSSYSSAAIAAAITAKPRLFPSIRVRAVLACSCHKVTNVQAHSSFPFHEVDETDCWPAAWLRKLLRKNSCGGEMRPILSRSRQFYMPVFSR